MNTCTIIGRSTKEVELKYTTGEKQIAIGNMTVAVDAGYGDKKRTNFIPVRMFGKTAEYAQKYLAKGKRVGVSGEFTVDQYEKDGQKKTFSYLKADRVEVLEYAETSKGSSAPAAPEGWEQIGDDDVPF